MLKNDMACLSYNIYLILLPSNHKNIHNPSKPSPKGTCPFKPSSKPTLQWRNLGTQPCLTVLFGVAFFPRQ